MNDRLAAIDDRLARADENIELVKDYLRTYHASDAYDIKGEFDPHENRGIWVTGVLTAPPLRVFTLVGDILHELRSALDQLAWQLVCVNLGEPGDDTAWPIIPTAPAPLKKGPNRGKLPLPNTEGGVSDVARALFGNAQPYLWEEDYMAHPMYVLNWLNIIDKHRHIAINAFGISNIVVAGDDPLPPFTWTAHTVTSSEHGAEVQFIPDDPKVDVQVTATLHIKVHEPTGRLNRPLFETLVQVRDAVREVFFGAEQTCFP